MSTVLVVEDEPAVCEVVAQVLEDEGYHVAAAHSVSATLRLLPRVRPACLTLDLFLPDGHGQQVLDALASDPALASTPVVVVSAAPQTLRPTPQVRAIVPKPFDLELLVQAVKRAIGEYANGHPRRGCSANGLAQGAAG